MSTKQRFTIVIVVLLVLSGIGAAIGLTQGPRLSSVQADPAGAIAASGSRVVLTLNQAIGEIDEGDVVITPAVDHTVDVSGRTVGVRFTHPLDEGIDYTITLKSVQSVGGGPVSDVTTTFTTPTADIAVLQRGSGSDQIVLTAVADDATPRVLFEHAQIEDFRRAGDEYVVVVQDGETSRVLVLNAAGEEVRELPLPGEGVVSRLQVSDRGNLLGYVYSDVVLSETEGRVSVLFFADLGGDEPRAALRGGEEVQTDSWQFVPDATAAVFVDWNSELLLTDAASEAEPTPLGSAMALDGIAHGTYQALVQQRTGWVLIDLRSGESTPATVPEGIGTMTRSATLGVPLTSDVVLWPVTDRDEAGMPIETSLIRLDGDKSTTLMTLPTQDPILQVCSSPSGDRLAVTVVPDLIKAKYDGHRQPLPTSVETRIIDSSTGQELLTISGFSASWCTEGPW